MKVTELRKGSRTWCSWMNCTLLYMGKASDGKYKFEDFGDKIHYLTENDVAKLRMSKK